MKHEIKRAIFKGFFTGMGVVFYILAIYLLLQFALFIARSVFVF